MHTMVILQYYSVLQSTTPVLICTTKFYSSTTLYQVLLQYYSVLPQSSTPVLQSTSPVLCTTEYYSSTTLYYKVLLQYYSVLQSTSPVLLCTTKYYSSTTLYYKVLLCTTKYYSVLQSTFTHETLVTMRGATRVSLQLQQVLRLPRKMTLMINPLHT